MSEADTATSDAIRREIDGLHAKATPGVWKLLGTSVHADQDGTGNVATSVPVCDTYCRDENQKPRTWDADLIAATHNHWPTISAALAEAETLRRKAEAFDHIIANSEWHRYDVGTEERSDHMAFRVAPGSDLSCKVTRELAVLAAIEAATAKEGE